MSEMDRERSLTPSVDIFVQLHMRLQYSQVSVGLTLQRHCCLLLKNDFPHKLVPAGHVQDRDQHISDAEGVISPDGLARDWEISIWIVGAEARPAIEQVENKRLDPCGKSQLEIHLGLEAHDHGVRSRLFHSCADNIDIGLVDDQLRDCGENDEEACG